VKDDLGWKITHGTVRGVVQTDLLTSSVTTIWMDVFKDTENQFFRILTDFKEVNSNLVYNPSRVTVRLSTGEILRARGFLCSEFDPKVDLQGLRRHPQIEEILVNRNTCYYLFFDHSPPTIEEEIIVYMNDSLTSNGKKVDVPPIYFSKTVERKFRWGLFQ